MPDPVTYGHGTTSIAGLMAKALAEGTGSSGGHLVPVELAAEVLRSLRARSAVMRMGPRVVPVDKELDVASISTGAAAFNVGGNASIPVSEPTFALAPLLRPRDLAALVPVSYRLLRDAASNPSAEEIIRTDLAEVLALRADLAFMRGTGTSTEPPSQHSARATLAENGARGRFPRRPRSLTRFALPYPLTGLAAGAARSRTSPFPLASTPAMRPRRGSRCRTYGADLDSTGATL